MTPEQAYVEARQAINQEQWAKAAAYATTGLLDLAIGAAKGLLKASEQYE